MARKTPSNAATRGPFAEMGASGLRQFSGYVREEFLKDLMGWRGLRMYREMRDNDPIIGAMFFAMERLLMSVDYSIEPASEDPDDIALADFIESCVGDMEQSWPEIISEILTFLQYGWAVQEIVYKKRNGQTNNPTTRSRYDDGLIGWRKFASRAQESLLHWDFDESGDAVAMVQLLPTGGPLLAVPLAKCLHFRTRLLKNNPEGVSLLRNCYVPYYRKKRIEEIEAIGLERDLAGMPIAWVPPRLLAADASEDDKAQLEALRKMVRDTVRNDQEGFLFPLAYDANKNKMYDFTLLSTGGHRQFDTTAIIDRYDHRICVTWLADFLMLGRGSSSNQGTGAQHKGKTDMFAVAAVSFLDMIVNEFNRKGIPDLAELNQMKGNCLLRHGEIDEGAVGDFTQALLDGFQAASITPDSRTEAAVREKIGLPPQQGVNPDDLNTGGDGGEGDNDPAETVSQNPADAQGRGQGAGADDPGPAAGQTAKSRGGLAKGGFRFSKRFGGHRP